MTHSWQCPVCVQDSEGKQRDRGSQPSQHVDTTHSLVRTQSPVCFPHGLRPCPCVLCFLFFLVRNENGRCVSHSWRCPACVQESERKLLDRGSGPPQHNGTPHLPVRTKSPLRSPHGLWYASGAFCFWLFSPIGCSTRPVSHSWQLLCSCTGICRTTR